MDGHELDDLKSRRGSFAVVEITSKQKRDWDDTRMALTWHAPAFAYILCSMMNPKGDMSIAVFTKDVPIAATDGVQLLLNPDTFFKYSLHERVFIVAHEIMHNIYNHCAMIWRFRVNGAVKYPNGSSLPYSQGVMNIATDLVINDMLIESNTGTYNKAWLHDTKLGKAADSAIDVYKKVFEHLDKQGKIVQVSFDEHLAPGQSQGKDPSSAEGERSEQEWKQAIAAATAAAKAQGKLPASLERLFGDFLNPQVDWTDKIQAFFARKVGSGAYNWRKPDRRMIVRDMYAPGRTGNGAGLVVLAVDTSGSIGGPILDRFFAEMSGILEDVRPETLRVVWCDAKVQRVDDIYDTGDLNVVRHKGAAGGGGTDFRPVFDYLDENDIVPDALVYLTDGYGSFPAHAPEYPVLWGNITKDYKYPFGDVVDVPV